MEKPKGFWKCRVCGQMWLGKQLYLDHDVPGIVWTCGDLFCGGTCDRVKGAEEDGQVQPRD